MSQKSCPSDAAEIVIEELYRSQLEGCENLDQRLVFLYETVIEGNKSVENSDIDYLLRKASSSDSSQDNFCEFEMARLELAEYSDEFSEVFVCVPRSSLEQLIQVYNELADFGDQHGYTEQIIVADNYLGVLRRYMRD